MGYVKEENIQLKNSDNLQHGEKYQVKEEIVKELKTMNKAKENNLTTLENVQMDLPDKSSGKKSHKNFSTPKIETVKEQENAKLNRENNSNKSGNKFNSDTKLIKNKDTKSVNNDNNKLNEKPQNKNSDLLGYNNENSKIEKLVRPEFSLVDIERKKILKAEKLNLTDNDCKVQQEGDLDLLDKQPEVKKIEILSLPNTVPEVLIIKKTDIAEDVCQLQNLEKLEALKEIDKFEIKDNSKLKKDITEIQKNEELFNQTHKINQLENQSLAEVFTKVTKIEIPDLTKEVNEEYKEEKVDKQDKIDRIKKEEKLNSRQDIIKLNKKELTEHICETEQPKLAIILKIKKSDLFGEETQNVENSEPQNFVEKENLETLDLSSMPEVHEIQNKALVDKLVETEKSKNQKSKETTEKSNFFEEHGLVQKLKSSQSITQTDKGKHDEESNLCKDTLKTMQNENSDLILKACKNEQLKHPITFTETLKTEQPDLTPATSRNDKIKVLKSLKKIDKTEKNENDNNFSNTQKIQTPKNSDLHVQTSKNKQPKNQSLSKIVPVIYKPDQPDLNPNILKKRENTSQQKIKLILKSQHLKILVVLKKVLKTKK